MDSKVISLHGETLPGEPDENIIRDLERLLEQARAGDLTGIAYAASMASGAQATGWNGVAGSRHPLGTAIMMIHHRYAQALRE